MARLLEAEGERVRRCKLLNLKKAEAFLVLLIEI
jgi:hypothetical protein